MWHRFHKTSIGPAGSYVAGLSYDLPAAIAAGLKDSCEPCLAPWAEQTDTAAAERARLAHRRAEIQSDLASLRERADTLAVMREELEAALGEANAARVVAEKASDPLRDIRDASLDRRYWESEIIRGSYIQCGADLALVYLDIRELTDELAGIEATLQAEGASDEPQPATNQPRATTSEPQPTSHNQHADGSDVRPEPTEPKGTVHKARRSRLRHKDR